MTNSESMFSEKEIEYLRLQHLARIATFSPDGIPDVSPVGFDFDGIFFYNSRMNVTKMTKYRNILKNSNIPLVIDNLKTDNPWDTRGIKIQAIAEIVAREQLPEGQLKDNSPLRSTCIKINPSESGAGEQMNLYSEGKSILSRAPPPSSPPV